MWLNASSLARMLCDEICAPIVYVEMSSKRDSPRASRWTDLSKHLIEARSVSGPSSVAQRSP